MYLLFLSFFVSFLLSLYFPPLSFSFPRKVSHLDEVAMGSEERQELEAKIDDLEERVDEYEKTQKDIFLTICQVRLSTLFTDLNPISPISGTHSSTEVHCCSLRSPDPL